MMKQNPCAYKQTDSLCLQEAINTPLLKKGSLSSCSNFKLVTDSEESKFCKVIRLMDVNRKTLFRILFDDNPVECAYNVSSNMARRTGRRINDRDILEMYDVDNLTRLRCEYCGTEDSVVSKKHRSLSDTDRPLTRKERYELYLELEATQEELDAINERKRLARIKRIKARQLQRELDDKKVSLRRVERSFDEIDPRVMDKSFKRLTLGNAPRGGNRKHPKKRYCVESRLCAYKWMGFNLEYREFVGYGVLTLLTNCIFLYSALFEYFVVFSMFVMFVTQAFHYRDVLFFSKILRFGLMSFSVVMGSLLGILQLLLNFSFFFNWVFSNTQSRSEFMCENTNRIYFTESGEVKSDGNDFHHNGEMIDPTIEIENKDTDDSIQDEGVINGSCDITLNYSIDESGFFHVLKMFEIVGLDDDALKAAKLLIEPLERHMPTTGDFWTAFVILCYQTYRSKNFLDYFTAFYNFSASALGRRASSYYRLVRNFCKVCYTLQLAAENDGTYPGKKFFAESDYHKSQLTSQYENFKMFLTAIVSSEFGKAFRNFVLAIVSLKLFSEDFSKSIHKYLGKEKKGTMLDIIFAILEGVGMLMQLGDAIVSGAPLVDVLVGKDPIKRCIDESQKLLYYKELTYSGLPVEGCMERSLFYSKLVELEKTMLVLKKDMSSFDPRKKKFMEAMQAVSECKLDYYKRMAAHRKAPIGVVLHGPPGIGKSYILPLIAQIHCEVMGRTFSRDMIYPKNKESDFWEGHESWSQKYIHYSEIGNVSENQALKNGDKNISEIQSLMDSLAYALNMAFAEKGKVFANPDMILIDTNNLDMHIDKLMYCASALFRRFLYITATVLQEFRVDGGVSIDAQASLEAGGDHYDRYNFCAFVRKPTAAGYKQVILYEGRVAGLVDFLRLHFTNFISTADDLDEIFKQRESRPLTDFYPLEEKVFVEESGFERMNTLKGDVIRVFLSGCFFLKFLLLYILHLFVYSTGIFSFRQKVFLLAWVLFFVVYTGWSNFFLFVVGLMLLFYVYFKETHVVRKLVTNFAMEKLVDNLREAKNFCYSKMVATYRSDFFNKYTSGKYFMAGSMLLAIVVLLRKLVKSALSVDAEGKLSNFTVNHDVDDEIHDFEEEMNITPGRVRVKCEKMAIWNEITPIPRSSHAGNSISLYPTIANNVRMVHVVYKNGAYMNTHILGLCNSFALMNYHAVNGNSEFTLEVILQGTMDKPTAIQKIPFDENDYVILGNDLMILNMRTIVFHSIITHIYDGEIGGKSKGVFYGTPVIVQGDNRVTNLVNSRQEKIPINGMWHYLFIKHEVGHCGNPVIMDIGNGAAVVAIHGGGCKDLADCFGVPLNRTKIKDGIQKLKAKNDLFVPASFNFESDIVVEHPIPKSPFMHENFAYLTYFGKITGKTLINSRSRLEKTIFGKKFEQKLKSEFDFERTQKYGIPMMKPGFVDGEYVSPYNIALNKLNNTTTPLPTSILSEAANIYTKYIVQGLRARGVNELSALTCMEAINGVENDPFIRRVDASKSGGFGFPGLKDAYIPLCDPESVSREPTLYLKERVLRILKAYNEGNMAGFISKTQLKDEPRELSKCREGKTRVFYMSALDALIVSRMLLGNFYSLIVEFGEVFGTAVGINAMKNGDEVRNRLLNLSNFIMAGDFKAFDVSYPFFGALVSSTVTFNVCRELRMNKKCLRMLQGLLTDMLFPVICMNNDLFMKPGNQPSGWYATAEENSKRAVILLILAWLLNPLLRRFNFFENVVPTTYGDDLAAAISEKVKDIYNNLSFAVICNKHFNLEYTSPDKVSELTPYCSVDELTFLKRRFDKKIGGKYVGCLDMNSIYKSLEWSIPSQHVTEFERMCDNVTSMLWELFLHSEDAAQYYRLKMFLIQCLVDEYGEEVRRLPFPTYAQLYKAITGDDMVDMEEVTDFHQDLVYCVEGRLFSLKLRDPPSKLLGSLGLPRILLFTSATIILNKRRADLLSRRMSLIDLKENYQSMLNDVDRCLADCKSGDLSLAEFNATTTIYENQDMYHQNYDRIQLLSQKADLEASIEIIDNLLLKLVCYRTESGVESSTGIGQIPAVVMRDNENFDDVGGTIIEEKTLGMSFDPPVGQQPHLQLNNFMDRPVPIASGTVALNGTLSAIYPVWDIISKVPSVRAKFKNHTHFRGNIRLRIAVTGTPQHYGCILASYQPHAGKNANLIAHANNLSANANWRYAYLAYLSQAPGAVTIDVRLNKPIEIVIPFISPKPMLNLFNVSNAALAAGTSYTDFADMGSLYFFTMVPPQCVQSGTSTGISYNIIGWFEDVELSLPTATNIAITTESKENERKTGPVERISSGAASIAGALGKVPFLAPFAIPSQMILSGIAKFASWFGWSRPPILEEPHFVKNRPFCNSAVCIGSETVEKLSYDPLKETAVDGYSCASDRDDMVIHAITSREGFFDSFTWAHNSAINTVLYKQIVHPQLVTVIADAGFHSKFQPTPMAFAAAAFDYWHGDITFRAHFVVSQFHRGKIAVWFEPNHFQEPLISAALTLNKNYIQIVDLEITNNIEFTVCWAHCFYWLRTLAPTAVNGALNVGSGLASAFDIINGYICFAPYTTLTSPDNSDITVLLFARSENMQFQQVTHSNLPIERKYLTESKYNEPIIDSGVTSVCLNSSTASTDRGNDYHFGEQPISFRTLCKRYVTTYSRTHTATATYLSVNFTQNIIPDINPAYHATMVGTAYLLAYLRYAYVGLRGDVCKRLHIAEPDGLGDQARCNVTLGSMASSVTETSTNSSVISSTIQRGCVSFVPNTNGGIEVELPWYNQNQFVFSFANDLKGSIGSGEMAATWCMGYAYVVDKSGAINDTINFQEETATAEDFTLMRFQGAPYYSSA